MENVAIEVRNLCIDYRPLKKISIIKDVFHGETGKGKKFRAVNDVSFSVEKGHILGIVGKNGSGKSTLLKAIAGIFKPDEGNIDLKDNSISLLSIGVGFNDEMSGRKNILLSGMLLGFSEEEISKRMDSIIEFAEIGEHIDNPVKTYSSGMYSKLAFSITANLETDIMLIDEVLSVGDEHFKKKSMKKMKELITDKNRTVIIVSHDMSVLNEFCDEILWLHNGRTQKYGGCEEVLNEYKSFMSNPELYFDK